MSLPPFPGFAWREGRLYHLRRNKLPHRHPPAVETLQAPAGEQLVAGEAHLLQSADGHLFAQVQAGQRVRAPVQAGEIAAEADVRGQLVELAADRQVRPLPRLE